MVQRLIFLTMTFLHSIRSEAWFIGCRATFHTHCRHGWMMTSSTPITSGSTYPAVTHWGYIYGLVARASAYTCSRVPHVGNVVDEIEV